MELIYLNTKGLDNPVAELKKISGGDGFDEVYILAPVPAVVEQGDAILGLRRLPEFLRGPDQPGVFRAVQLLQRAL